MARRNTLRPKALCRDAFERAVAGNRVGPHGYTGRTLQPESQEKAPMQTDLPLALRPRQAAEALGISVRHLWQLTHDGVIPCIRVGCGSRKTVLYSADALRQWLSSSTSGGRQSVKECAR